MSSVNNDGSRPAKRMRMEEQTPFQKAVEKIDHSFRLEIGRSFIIPFKVGAFTCSNPKIAAKSHDEVKWLDSFIRRFKVPMGLALIPHVGRVAGKTFMATLDDKPFLVQSTHLESAEKQRMTIKEDRLECVFQKSSIILYPLHK